MTAFRTRAFVSLLFALLLALLIAFVAGGGAVARADTPHRSRRPPERGRIGGAKRLVGGCTIA